MGQEENLSTWLQTQAFLTSWTWPLLLLRGVNHCCATTSLREQGQNRKEDFAFLSHFCCLHSTSAEQTAELYVLLLRLHWLPLHSITKVAQFGSPGPNWRSWFSALVTSDSLLEPNNVKVNQSSLCETPGTTLENLIKCRKDLPYTSNLSLHRKKQGWKEMGHCLLSSNGLSLYLSQWISIMRQRCRTRKYPLFCTHPGDYSHTAQLELCHQVPSAGDADSSKTSDVPMGHLSHTWTHCVWEQQPPFLSLCRMGVRRTRDGFETPNPFPKRVRNATDFCPKIPQQWSWCLGSREQL